MVSQFAFLPLVVQDELNCESLLLRLPLPNLNRRSVAKDLLPLLLLPLMLVLRLLLLLALPQVAFLVEPPRSLLLLFMRLLLLPNRNFRSEEKDDDIDLDQLVFFLSFAEAKVRSGDISSSLNGFSSCRWRVIVLGTFFLSMMVVLVLVVVFFGRMLQFLWCSESSFGEEIGYKHVSSTTAELV